MSVGAFAVWFLWAALCYVAIELAARIIRVSGSRLENPGFSEIRIWLRCLLENGYDGETVLFRDKRYQRFIRFQKYVEGSGDPGIELTFPEIGWGAEFVPRLRAYAEQKGLAFRGSEEGEPGYARVKLGKDINEAFALCRMIWSGFYGYAEKARYLRQVGDLSDIDELVDASARSQLSAAELQQRWTRYMNARARHTGLRWLQAAGWSRWVGFGALVSIGGMSFEAASLGLPVTTLLSLGDPPAWQLDLGPIELQGSTASLIFFFVYLMSREVLRRLMRFRLIDRQGMSRIERILHAPKQTVHVVMPIAVVLVWLGI